MEDILDFQNDSETARHDFDSQLRDSEQNYNSYCIISVATTCVCVGVNPRCVGVGERISHTAWCRWTRANTGEKTHLYQEITSYQRRKPQQVALSVS